MHCCSHTRLTPALFYLPTFLFVDDFFVLHLFYLLLVCPRRGTSLNGRGESLDQGLAPSLHTVHVLLQPLGHRLAVYRERWPLSQSLRLDRRSSSRLRLLLLFLTLDLLELLEAVNVHRDLLLFQHACVLVPDRNADALGVDEVAVLVDLGRKQARAATLQFHIEAVGNALVPLHLQLLFAHEAAVLGLRVRHDVLQLY